jgi:Cdc6-like AAA superfamily ATPase
MANWFGLSDGHKDFFIEIDTHASLFFARNQLNEQLQALLRKSFRTGNPPKFVLFGDWGTGKTHTMRHIEYVIRTHSDYNGYPVFVDMPDIRSKDNFQAAYAVFLDALGLNLVRNWMLQYQSKHQSKAMDTIQHVTQSEDIAKAFMSLFSFGDTMRISWDWLRGLQLSAADARNAGLPPALSQSNQQVSVLRMLGRLSVDVEDKLLIFMLDEADKLRSVTNSDAIAHWVNAFRMLADKQTKEVGLIVSASFRDDDMHPALADEQVKTRFGERNYIQLQNFGNEEAVQFVSDLLENWTDPNKRAALLDKYDAERNAEPINSRSFPFTEKAFKRFIDYVLRNGGITTPRDIQHAIDAILNTAIDDKRHILSRKYLDSLFAASIV